MSTSCEVVPGTAATYTVVSTSTVYGTAVSTAPASTVTSSTPVVASSCVSPTVAGGLSRCETTTSFLPVQTVLPGAVTTITSSSESLVTITETRRGRDRTVCSTLPVATSSTTSAVVGPTSTTAVSTTAPVLAASTSTTFATTTVTSTPSSPSPPSDPAVASSSATLTVATLPSSLPTAVDIVATSSSADVRRVTSFVTSWVTIVDASGRTVSSASAIPTLLNMPDSSSSSSNVGAIAGGTVGGVAALALAGIIFLLMRKRGYFRKGDEEIEEDVWNPAPHGEYYGGSVSRRNGGGGGGGGAALAAAAMGVGGRSSPDEKGGDGVSDEDRKVDEATLERHQSWYRSLHGHGSELGHEEAYSGEMAQRPASPVVAQDLMGYVPHQLAYASPRSRTSHGPQRSMSNRASVLSHSSYGHSLEGSIVPGILQPVPIPDLRLSQISQYGYYQAFAPPVPPAAAAPYPDGLARDASRSPPPHSQSQPQFDRLRSASPTVLAQDPFACAPSPPEHVLARQRSLPGLALPVHMCRPSHGARPILGALQMQPGSGSGSSGGSSGSPSRGRTDDSLSSGSGSDSSPHSAGPEQSFPMPVLVHSASDATLTTTAMTTPSAGGYDSKPPLPSPPAAHTTIERLKRPGLDRADSTESILAPSQWLGARVVNADEVASLAGRSAESLAA